MRAPLLSNHANWLGEIVERGYDGIGTIGAPTTLNSGDLAGVIRVAAQALEKRTAEQREALEGRIAKEEARFMNQEREVSSLRAENADLKARLEALERRLGSDVLSKAE